MGSHERRDYDADRPPGGRSASPRAQRPEPQHSQSHEFLEHLRRRVAPEVASLKGMQRAIEDGRHGRRPADSAAWDGRGALQYGDYGDYGLPGPPEWGGKKKKGPVSVANGPDLFNINARMRVFVADATADRALCFEKFGKARRKSVRAP